MNEHIDNILLFKTNMSTIGDKHIMQSIFDQHPQIDKWSLDFEDNDCVLRIISTEVTHAGIIEMVKLHGYHCEELKD